MSMEATCGDRTSRQRLSPVCRARANRDLQHYWLDQLAFGPERKRDELVQMWLGIFPVAMHQVRSPGFLLEQVNTIRANMAGSYKDLLLAMVQNGAVQRSLNNTDNKKEQPNENMARELLELFSLGEGSYTERDVIETARALTGYRLTSENVLEYLPDLHDDKPQTILGRRKVFTAVSLVDWLCEQPQTAIHIIGRVWPTLVGPKAKKQRIKSIALKWREKDLSLPWLVETLRQSEEAIEATGRRVDSPVMMMSRSLALIGSRHPDALSIGCHNLKAMGQNLFNPPSVKGWPTNTDWINLRWFEARRRGLLALIGDEEVWASRELPEEIKPTVTAIQPLTISLPARSSRENVTKLLADPVWQLT
jgi:uncharacterized protein (DUF1800 family)